MMMMIIINNNNNNNNTKYNLVHSSNFIKSEHQGSYTGCPYVPVCMRISVCQCGDTVITQKYGHMDTHYRKETQMFLCFILCVCVS